MLSLTLCILLTITCGVSSHGNMKLPYTWYDSKKEGTTKYSVGCIYPEVPPTDEPPIWPNVENWKNGKGKRFCQEGWFTNNTKIPGQQTISGLFVFQYLLGSTYPLYGYILGVNAHNC